MNPTIEEARPLVAKHLASIESPRGSSEILAKLKESYNKHMECGCQSCSIDAALEAETYVVIEEALKMVAETSENGVAGLIYRLHLSRELAMEDVSNIRADRKISEAVVRKLLNSLIGGPSLPPGMPPELREILMGRRAPGVTAIEVPEGEKIPDPPPGFVALEGKDALAFLKSYMAGEDIPPELRERLDRKAERDRENEESAEQSDSE